MCPNRSIDVTNVLTRNMTPLRSSFARIRNTWTIPLEIPHELQRCIHDSDAIAQPSRWSDDGRSDAIDLAKLLSGLYLFESVT
jgi:hypothetical protein